MVETGAARGEVLERFSRLKLMGFSTGSSKMEKKVHF